MSSEPERLRSRRRLLRGGLALGVLGCAGAPAAETADRPELIAFRAPGGRLRAAVAPSRGGELASLELNLQGRWVELLYRGNDYSPTTDFLGRAPILWPATGRNFLGEPSAPPRDEELGWRVNGQAYPMPIHGFARDLPWRVERREPARVALSLTDTPATRRRYPFGFRLASDYSLSGDSLVLRQTVAAAPGNTGPMPFSIGNHIAFRLPLSPGSDPAATTFQSPGRREVLTDAATRPTGETRRVDYNRPTPVTSMKTRVPIGLTDYPTAAPWARLIDPSGLSVTVSHIQTRTPAGDPILFNLWADLAKGFFSPEAWLGKPNSLASGDGAVSLPPGETFDWALTVRVETA